jgi:rare lipoprotein A
VNHTLRWTWLLTAIIGISIIYLGCTSSPKFRRDEIKRPSVKWELPNEPYQVGIASYYGKKFHGRPTSSGDIFDMYDMTAAHQTLPLGSQIQVTHLGNHRSVIVTVNDRGPFVEGRILDLSYGAAKKLGMIEEGIAEVRIDVFRFGEKE